MVPCSRFFRNSCSMPSRLVWERHCLQAGRGDLWRGRGVVCRVCLLFLERHRKFGLEEGGEGAVCVLCSVLPRSYENCEFCFV